MRPTTAMRYTIVGLILLSSLTASAATRYVWPGSPNPAPPYADWNQAAHVIQDAVDASAAGDEIVVTNGVYATGGRAVYGTMTNRVAVDRAVTLRSVNGPLVTVIRGYQVPGVTNGDGAVRCVYLTDGAVLSGFTLTNGATRGSGDTYREQCGGGLWCESTGSIATNCTIVGNIAGYGGGGVYQGTLSDCALTDNSSLANGGGACYATFKHCKLTGNWARYGGGAYGGTLTYCVLSGNSATGWGGGACYSALNNCALTGNSASANGGGVWTATLNWCALKRNSADCGAAP